MCKEYIEQLNQLIGIAPHLAYAEIKTSRRDTLIDLSLIHISSSPCAPCASLRRGASLSRS